MHSQTGAGSAVPRWAYAGGIAAERRITASGKTGGETCYSPLALCISGDSARWRSADACALLAYELAAHTSNCQSPGCVSVLWAVFWCLHLPALPISRCSRCCSVFCWFRAFVCSSMAALRFSLAERRRKRLKKGTVRCGDGDAAWLRMAHAAGEGGGRKARGLYLCAGGGLVAPVCCVKSGKRKILRRSACARRARAHTPPPP